ncbi:MAG: tRNA lysidine(34) synthetase TilS [Bacteroidales bacterium]|nr:tRNA lysidine(34) synthetase TilS [Bacteroidales bacterium]
MIKKFETYIDTNRLFNPNNRILAAVSGGIDSMVMLHLLLKLEYKPAIAHCNFHLRGGESDGDEEFVKQFAEINKLQFFNISFDTKKYAEEKKMSVQMAARELRYEWLNKTALENGFDCITVGHNSDDSIETFFINLTRNAGIHGLTGIKPKNNLIVRPLLFASRREISAFAQDNNILFREDSSNAETKYLRNKIRHNIIPELEKINPSFRENIHEVIEKIKEAEKLLNEVTGQYRKSIVVHSDDRIYINFREFPGTDIARTVLFELLKDYGFNGSQVKEIADSLQKQPGSRFYSPTHWLVKDRDHLIITPIKPNTAEEVYIGPDSGQIESPIKLTFRMAQNENFVIPREKNTVAIDADRLTFPLKLRRWKPGDRFMPFGMEHYKKLSDFFVDNKLSLADKELVWVIESDGKIVWVVNYRTDNRFRVKPSTKSIFLIESDKQG